MVLNMRENKVKPIDKRKPEVALKKIKEPNQKNKSFPVVGIGGSAGSFTSYEKFFTHMPPDSGMAFIVIMHLHPDHKGNLASVIQQYTPMPVMEAIDGTEIEADKVYLIPP